ncbi:putative hydrophobic protein (TIGR00341 family) [Parvibaculum indicum]|uniref:TIGR00341 family protein n=1 Tax=Parvibaculum indicum TaxID=562969 RepID=UPI00141E3AFC|nr:TIGR00341 family protein [Parvibaculum indicum]NIJ40972.1 putative hydrophobic protein (TIGR00341 family) [Parvibaculum indicum]
MTLRVVEVTAPEGYADTLKALAEQQEADDIFVGLDGSVEDKRCLVRIVCETKQVQAFTDAVQQAVGRGEDWRATVLPVEAMVPQPERETAARRSAFTGGTASREEIYDEVARGAEPDSTFFILVILSAIVAAIGLLDDNLAVVIGAMVIAPLLGPNLAFALATALGDRDLMIRSMVSNLAGISVTLMVGAATAMVWTGGFTAHQLVSRTMTGYDAVALALASGAAAVLSLITGLSSALVGVMVAVALMPPAVTAGIMLGAGDLSGALGAFVLLGVNVVCVNLAAQAVFVAKGIKPRTWWEQRASRASVVTNFVMWGVLLAALVVAIWWLKLPLPSVEAPGF